MRRRLVGRSNPFVMGCKTMSTGTSKTALAAVRIALLTGVSAAALFAAGSANAQGVVNPPFVIGDTYSKGVSGNPSGANLTGVTIPGVNITSRRTQVLEDTSGAVVTTAGALNSNGTPKIETYQQYITANPNTYQLGSGSNNGDVLVNAATGALVTTLPSGQTLTGTAVSGYAWKPLTAPDRYNNVPLYNWTPATYVNDLNVGKSPTAAQFTGTSSSAQSAGSASNFYVIDSSGKAVTGSAYFTAINTTTESAQIKSACGGYAGSVGNGFASTSACLAQINAAAAAAGNASQTAGWQVVSGNATDPNLVNTPNNYTYSGLTSSPQGKGNGTVDVNQGATASTTSFAGGVVYANRAGSSTVIGPDGITGTGWTLTIQNPSGTSKTVISNGNYTSTETTGANAGSTNIDGSFVHVSTPVGAFSNDVFLTGNGLRFNNTANVDTITMSTSTGNIATVGSLTVGNGMTVTGVSTFKGVGAEAGTTTTINGALATFNGSSLGNGATVVSGGSVAINGGAANSNLNGNINTLAVAGNPATGNPGALNVNGGAVINNGLEVNNGLRVTGPSQGQGPQTIDMGGNRVQDVATPIFGTDAANKAYVDRGLNKAYEGTAIALAISQPIIGPNQTFAIRAGWGTYESENAFGLSAAGIIGRDWFWNGSTVALDGGVGWGSDNSVAGKAGVTLAFGPGYAAAAPLPLK